MMRWLVAITLAAMVAGCERERRDFNVPNGDHLTQATRLTALQPGAPSQFPDVRNPFEGNAYALSEGKRLFAAYNCNGCHANGGGDKGPALMDDVWIYGGQPANIYTTIVEGRPNGMPSFGGHMPDEHVWQLVAYIRSMSGLVPVDAAPGRDDAMQSAPAENRREAEVPVPAAVPPSSQQSK